MAKQIDKLEFDLASLESILDDGQRFLADSLNGPLPEITVGPNFTSAIIANKHRFVRHLVGPADAGMAGRAVGVDLNIIVGHPERS